MENIKKEAKIVFNPGVSRKLLKMGATIIDIKQDKTNPDKTLFVFKRDEAFEKAFSQINAELAAAKDKEVTAE